MAKPNPMSRMKIAENFAYRHNRHHGITFFPLIRACGFQR